LSRIAGILEYKQDQSAYALLSERIGRQYHQRFWDAASEGYGTNNQSCNAISLYMGLTAPQSVESVAANLLRSVVDLNGCHLTTGNICTKYLLEALTATGHADVAFRVATQESYPSWGYMLANGATTLWERWELATGSGMNSHNHPMLGSVGAWIYRTIAGIQADPNGPGFARFDLRPHFDERLDHARAVLQTVRGEVQVAWKRDAGQLVLQAVVPVGSQARIFLPAATGALLEESGTIIWRDGQPIIAGRGIESIESVGDLLVCRVGSGQYSFRLEVPAPASPVKTKPREDRSIA
jgi:alpha-L-rhamnosidase